jgi:pimeloyl-ACP methyl ester carboxylesterase
MTNCRLYGTPSYTTAVVHGGPGAPGEMAPVARELSNSFGVMEPLQTAETLDDQVEELKSVIEKHSNQPVNLIGHSWGAMLGFITTARYPSIIKKLILVGSSPFEAEYAKQIMPTRMERLNKQEQVEISLILANLQNTDVKNKTLLMQRLGKLVSKSDSYSYSYSPLPHQNKVIECNGEQFAKVWSEAEEMRKTGELLSQAAKITCPVTAIHGSYDPHPADGVRIPLSKTLTNFKFVLLEKCGHEPWTEEYASDRFYEILLRECA